MRIEKDIYKLADHENKLLEKFKAERVEILRQLNELEDCYHYSEEGTEMEVRKDCETCIQSRKLGVLYERLSYDIRRLKGHTKINKDDKYYSKYHKYLILCEEREGIPLEVISDKHNISLEQVIKLYKRALKEEKEDIEFLTMKGLSDSE